MKNKGHEHVSKRSGELQTNLFLLIAVRVLYGSIIFLFVFLLVIPRPNFMASTIEQVINARMPEGTTLSGLTFSKIELSISSASIRNVSFTLKQSQNRYTVTIENILLSDVWHLVSSAACPVLIEEMDVASEALKIHGADGNAMVAFMSEKISARGDIFIDRVGYKEYGITDVYVNFDVTDKSVVFNRVRAQAYEGQLKARGSYRFFPDEKIEAALDFQGVDTQHMDTVNHQWKGVVNGTGSYIGTSKEIGQLTLDFRSASSDMEKTLLKYLMGDMGNNLAFLPFSTILENADFIHLENFQGKVHNLGQDSVVVSLTIDSRQLNLKLNPSITINLR